jgi:tetratricopeptide (TPR) repeat protein
VLDEVRPAVAWARDADPGLHARICAALAQYWVYSGVISEVAEELRRARDSGAGSPAERAWALTLLAKCVQLEGGENEACDLAERALTEWGAVDDELERALALPLVAWVFTWARRHEQAIALDEEALAILRRTGDRRLILRGLVFLAHVRADMKALDATETVLAEADELAQGDPIWELAAIHADLALDRGDHVRATELYAESLSWTSTTGESHQPLMDLRCLAACLSSLGDAEAAIEVFELVRLEEERTGRIADNTWLVEVFAPARRRADERAGRAVGHAAAARAKLVPSPDRAARAIALAAAAVVARGIQD